MLLLTFDHSISAIHGSRGCICSNKSRCRLHQCVLKPTPLHLPVTQIYMERGLAMWLRYLLRYSSDLAQKLGKGKHGLVVIFLPPIGTDPVLVLLRELPLRSLPTFVQHLPETLDDVICCQGVK